MPKRLINILRGNKISKRSEKLLRENVGQNSTKKIIAEARQQGVILGRSKETQKRQAYRYFADIYNERIEEENLEAEREKVRERERKRREKERRKTQLKVYNYNDLSRNILKQPEFRKLFRSKKGKDSSYSLRFISRVAGNNVRRTFNFSNYYHLRTWLDNIENEAELNPDSYNNTILTETPNYRNVFEELSIELRRSTGGYRTEGNVNTKVWTASRHKDIVRPITFNNYKAKVLDFKETNKGDMNCGFRCLNYILPEKVNVREWRKKLNIPVKTQLKPTDIAKVYNEMKQNNKTLNFIDESYDGDFSDDENYILLKDNHYTIINEWEYTNHQEEGKKKHHGRLAFDIETRPDDEIIMVGEQESSVLTSAILSMVYRASRGEKKKKTFITDRKQNCCLKFLDWLSEEAKNERYYHCVAHNGARFDFYLLMSYFNENDLLQSKTQLRGTSIIGLQYKAHTFKDTCCFLTDSLSNLCDGYLTTPEEKAFAKKTNIKLGNTMITNYQLCFYKPELGFWDFMELEKNEPEFWVEYVKYCEYDCESLYLVWEKFKAQVGSILGSMGYKMGVGDLLKTRISLNNINTIGSLSKKIIELLNTFRLKYDTSDYRKYKCFMDDDEEKYEFLKNFKRGGISHCNQMGHHTEGICGFDIKSQYPTALMEMRIPVGKSKWVKSYNPDMYGFYKLTNMVWTDKTRNQFKPIAHSEKGKSLDWACDIKENYVDSYMIKYLMENCGLLSFNVETALVSYNDMKGEKLFSHYVMTLYELKALEDKYKEADDDRYNEPFRSACKLLMNSLTGKLVEDPSRYFKLKFVEDDRKLKLNGVGVEKEENKNKIYADTDEKKAVDKKHKREVDFGCGWAWKYGHTKQMWLDDLNDLKQQGIPLRQEVGETKILNSWIVAGVMVYSYSKRLLWEYVKCLPNGADDVVHIETDGIYFGRPNREHFIKEVEKLKSPLIKIGDELGNVEEEVNTIEESFFLGKKDYLIGNVKMKDGSINYKKSKLRFKGIPKTTISDDGSKIELLDKQFYIDRYNGLTVDKTFKTIGKTLFDSKKTDKITLNGYNMTRRAIPRHIKKFKRYVEFCGNVVEITYNKLDKRCVKFCGNYVMV